MRVESGPRSIAIARELPRAWAIAGFRASTLGLERVGALASETAQQFGALLAVLMGPAVLSVYAFVAWCLAANLGWTDTFVFKSGPFSNWMIWFGAAALMTAAAGVLRRRSSDERTPE